jgi:thiol:disulfide interchange protein DsbA
MKRRHFSLAATSLGLLPFAPGAMAQGAPKPGEFLTLGKPAPVDAPAGKIEVVEFFSYNCPHCAAFEPRLEQWVKQLPANVVFRRIPVPFVGNDVEAKQRMYFALEAMGKVDQFQQAIFRAIHTEKQRLFGEEAILAWADKQQGLDGKKFAEMFKSFGVAGKARRATQMTEAYKVAGVPALGIAGRWYVDGELAGSLEGALRTADGLIAEARKS